MPCPRLVRLDRPSAREGRCGRSGPRGGSVRSEHHRGRDDPVDPPAASLTGPGGRGGGGRGSVAPALLLPQTGRPLARRYPVTDSPPPSGGCPTDAAGSPPLPPQAANAPRSTKRCAARSALRPPSGIGHRQSLHRFELGTYTYQNRHVGCHPGIWSKINFSHKVR